MEYQLLQILLEMERALSGLKGYDGWVIGTCCVGISSVFQDKMSGNGEIKEEVCKSSILRCGGAWAVVRIVRPRQEDFLQVMLLKPSQNEHSVRLPQQKRQSCSDLSEKSGAEIFCFYEQEIAWFLESVSDSNPIHRGSGAIVPGFLMMNTITGMYIRKLAEERNEGLTGINLDVKFLNPLRVGKKVLLDSQPSETNRGRFLVKDEHKCILKMKIEGIPHEKTGG